MVADLWQRKGKVSSCFKNSTSLALLLCQNKANFQRSGSGLVLVLLLIISKSRQCFIFIKEHFLSFKNAVNILERCQSPFFKSVLILILPEDSRSAGFETTSLPFLYHKSATTSQIDPYKVSNSKLKPDPCNCVKLR